MTFVGVFAIKGAYRANPVAATVRAASVFRTTRVLPADVYRIDGAKRLIHIRRGSCVIEGATSIAVQDNVSDASRRKACNKERPAGSTT